MLLASFELLGLEDNLDLVTVIAAIHAAVEERSSWFDFSEIPGGKGDSTVGILFQQRGISKVATEEVLLVLKLVCVVWCNTIPSHGFAHVHDCSVGIFGDEVCYGPVCDSNRVRHDAARDDGKEENSEDLHDV